MFYLLIICSCLIARLEINFSESFCFIGTSQFISSVHDLTDFYLMWVFTEFNLRTHMWAVFVLCVPFYKPAFDIIYLIAIRFSIIDVSSYREGFNLFVFDAGQLSSVPWRNRGILQQYTDFIQGFYLLFVNFPFIWVHILQVRLTQIIAFNYKFNIKRDNILPF